MGLWDGGGFRGDVNQKGGGCHAAKDTQRMELKSEVDATKEGCIKFLLDLKKAKR